MTADRITDEGTDPPPHQPYYCVDIGHGICDYCLALSQAADTTP